MIYRVNYVLIWMMRKIFYFILFKEYCFREDGGYTMQYISAQEAANKWGITKRRVQVLCASGRISGAVRIGNMWVLPEDVEKPVDARYSKSKTYSLAKEENPIRTVRNGIRSITQDMIKQLSNAGMDSHNAKLATLTMFAAELLVHYIRQTYSEVYERDVKEAATAIAQISGYHITSETLKCYQYQRGQLRTLLTDYPFCCDDLLSWCYQYINKFGEKSNFWNTQFFTEKYMIATLVDNIDVHNASKILDPACGGGNFLLYCFDILAQSEKTSNIEFHSKMECLRQKLFGYEIDSDLAMIASINMRLKYLSIRSAHGYSISLDDFLRFSPNIFYPENKTATGTLDICPEKQYVRKCGQKDERQALSTVLAGTDVIITNPPFQTIKGMPETQKNYLKRYYPKAKCDMCNAFIERLLSIVEPCGTVGIVSQNSWMYLDSFVALRTDLMANYSLLHIWELGSNAFYDLSGEKANAVLTLWRKEPSPKTHQFKLTLLKGLDQAATEAYLSGRQDGAYTSRILQQDIAATGCAFNLAGTKHLRTLLREGLCYGNFATAMQGTSTGNAKELIDFFWMHTGDPNWIPVSKGGGYARWQGLNHYCVKWGPDGSHIKETKGSAIRNAIYFPETKLVFSDTGTAGLNVRTLLDGQIFVASGPGIRGLRGNNLAHLAFLNSRLASYYIRLISPKLTVAAGYIAKLPASSTLLSSAQLEGYAKACLVAKRRRLQKRPNNMEFLPVKYEGSSLEACANQWYLEDICDEWTQLFYEQEIENEISGIMQLTEADLEAIDNLIGPKCVLKGTGDHLPSKQEIEDLMCRYLDSNCTLTRTKAKRNALGCDGIIEFLSQETKASCEELWQYFSQTCFYPSWLEEKYIGLYFHALVLSAMEYPTGKIECLSTEELAKRAGITESAEAVKLKSWLENDFNQVHQTALMNAPIFHYEHGTVRRLKGGAK